MELKGKTNPLLDNTSVLFSNALDTMVKKNADYAGNYQVSGLENFELSANLAKVSMSKTILVRLSDKIARISNLLDKEADVKDESIYDTIEDAINYLAIMDHALKVEKRRLG